MRSQLRTGTYFITNSSVILKERKVSICREKDPSRFPPDAVAICFLTACLQIVFSMWWCSRSAQLFVIEVIPLRSPDDEASWVRTSQDVQQFAYQKLVEVDAGTNHAMTAQCFLTKFRVRGSFLSGLWTRWETTIDVRAAHIVHESSIQLVSNLHQGNIDPRNAISQVSIRTRQWTPILVLAEKSNAQEVGRQSE